MVNRSANPYDSAGILHNLYLDSVYQKLNRAYEDGDIENLTETELMNTAIDSFNTIIDVFSDDPDKSSLEDDCISIINEVLNEKTNQYQLEIDSLEYSTYFNDIFDDLVEIYADSTSIDSILANIRLLVVNASQLEDQEEKVVALVGLAIAKHSSIYWYYNYENWETLVNNVAAFRKPSDVLNYKWYGRGATGYDCPDCEAIVEQDVAYGVTGAALGWFSGVGALASGGLAGGGASMAQAILNLF